MIPEEKRKKIEGYVNTRWPDNAGHLQPMHDLCKNNYLLGVGDGYLLAQEEKDSVIKFCEQKRNEVKGQHSDTLSLYADGKLDGQSVAYQDVINFLTKKKDPKDPPKPNRRQEFG